MTKASVQPQANKAPARAHKPLKEFSPRPKIDEAFPDREIIIRSKNTYFPCYLAKSADGTFYAGLTAECAKAYPSAQAVWEEHRPRVRNKNHSSWSICYHVEDYLGE